MGLIAKKSGSDFEMVPAGVAIARCYRLIDLGTQTTEFQGQKKQQHKVMYTWELLGEDRMSDGRPFSISKRYTASLHEKAQLRKDLVAWRGRDFTPEEEDAFELSKVVGAYCQLNIVHEPGSNGNEYANIVSIMPLPKGMPKPAEVNPKQIFDLDNPDFEIFNNLSEKLRDVITSSPEWAKPAAKPAQPTPEGSGFEDMPDDVDF